MQKRWHGLWGGWIVVAEAVKLDMGEVSQLMRYKIEDIFGVKLVDSKPNESEEMMD